MIKRVCCATCRKRKVVKNGKTKMRSCYDCANICLHCRYKDDGELELVKTYCSKKCEFLPDDYAMRDDNNCYDFNGNGLPQMIIAP